MLPGIDLRLRNMIKSIEDIVLPAIPGDQSLAREQARLIAGHLAIIKDQWRHAVRFEAGSLAALVDLAWALIPQVADDQARELSAAAEATARIDWQDIDALNASICAVGAAVDKVILGEEGTRPLGPEAWAAVLAYGEKDAQRQRTWFQGVGIDPDRSELPPVASLG
ncbi:hypothetical protein ACFSTD_12870 [Novosphingobium colocasiae]|uniref:Uncharacterized protein n=1 Tax=Novosphingobium colocasiae TaxID=1256513 RepID=A0A918PBM0_9SPHN|nr:hypothetical protein [Novosphingobium colocasiae]GGY98267.1 hypothetical protein GCM10011614_11770 [Novosphingobium colocasiae]